jgi:hypothetical protein
MFIKLNVNHRSAKFIAVFSLLAMFWGCKSSGNKGQEEEISINKEEINQDIKELKSDLRETKKIFYSLPSPLETAMLLKNAGAEYNEELLNPIENASNYTTNKKMALNLGIYTTDLSFASLFEQTQTTIDYMNASKEIADRLGLLEVFSDSTLKRLENNINNRDIIMDIISETLMSSSSYLKENNRAPLAAIVLIGGWMEGLYVSTQLVENTSGSQFKENPLVKRIADQKFSMDIVIKLIEKYSYNKDVASLLVTMNEIKAIYDKIEIKTTKIDPVKEEGEDITTLKSEARVTMSPEVFSELKSKVKTIRKNFIL